MRVRKSGPSSSFIRASSSWSTASPKARIAASGEAKVRCANATGTSAGHSCKATTSDHAAAPCRIVSLIAVPRLSPSTAAASTTASAPAAAISSAACAAMSSAVIASVAPLTARRLHAAPDVTLGRVAGAHALEGIVTAPEAGAIPVGGTRAIRGAGPIACASSRPVCIAGTIGSGNSVAAGCATCPVRPLASVRPVGNAATLAGATALASAKVCTPVCAGLAPPKALAGGVVAVGHALAMAGVVLPAAVLGSAAIHAMVDVGARLMSILMSPPPQLQLPKIAPAAAKPMPQANPLRKAPPG